ncbi:hypothetical protein GX411_01925 [Candidatus Fermentibacteria bacterium]|nr:hypothetical protein [Candidatus Fermentibacteria bacterium]
MISSKPPVESAGTGWIYRALIGQVRARALLEASFESGRLPHAFLFAGPRGTGKLTAALATASAWMCETGDNCGHCRHCRRVACFEHPDARITMPVTGSTTPDEVFLLLSRRVADGVTPVALPGNCWIPIESVREIQSRLALKPYEGRGRVEIVLDADRMKAEAANALLKTLEEPPPGTLLILTAVRASAILPTVRSRMQTVRFGRLSTRDIASALVSRISMESDEAERLAMASDGSLGAALEAATERDGLGDIVLETVEVLEKAGEHAVLEFSLELAKKLGTASSGRFCSAVTALLHDLARRASGLAPLYHPPSDIENRGAGWGLRGLEEAVEIFGRCERRLRSNVMPQAAISAAMLAAREALGGHA